MNVFKQAVDDLFKVKDFLETCQIEGELHDCVCSSVENGVIYSDSGLELNIPFRLCLKMPLRRMPKIGDRVKFRGTLFKIYSFDIDSASASISLDLQDLSKK